MSIIVSVRNGNISETLKTYAEDKITSLIENFPKITSARVILDAQKSRYEAEVIIRGKNFNVEASDESFDMYDSIDSIADKANTQLRKHYDKVQNHYKPSKHPITDKEEAEDLEEIQEYVE
ncbi:MAG TPA: ribosome-associated translation inhibitor RaiA [Victivallales bacterium]|nr:ribosome-associated translation inhibitor RaiA [Victivallales bacterium]